MKARQVLAGLAGLCMAAGLFAQGATPATPELTEAQRNALPDTQGTGRFPAVKQTDPRLQTKGIY